MRGFRRPSRGRHTYLCPIEEGEKKEAKPSSPIAMPHQSPKRRSSRRQSRRSLRPALLYYFIRELRVSRPWTGPKGERREKKKQIPDLHRRGVLVRKRSRYLSRLASKLRFCRPVLHRDRVTRAGEEKKKERNARGTHRAKSSGVVGPRVCCALIVASLEREREGGGKEKKKEKGKGWASPAAPTRLMPSNVSLVLPTSEGVPRPLRECKSPSIRPLRRGEKRGRRGWSSTG